MSENSFLSRMKDTFSSVVNSFMPMPEEEEFEEESAQERVSQKTQESRETSTLRERRVANGGTVSYDASSYGAGASSAASRTTSTGDSGTQFTVHTTKVAELKVRIHRPRRYDDAAPAVVQLKQGIAIAVNFDCMNDAERRRVCDFLNGACYVLHGAARVVSSTIILYAPKGVDVSEAMTMAK
jgi:cell division protein sepF 2